jgi:hypothetical protein
MQKLLSEQQFRVNCRKVNIAGEYNFVEFAARLRSSWQQESQVERRNSLKQAAATAALAGLKSAAAFRIAKWMCCVSRREDLRHKRSLTGSLSRRRPPITTSSISITRSPYRPVPPLLFGRCKTPSFSERAALQADLRDARLAP